MSKILKWKLLHRAHCPDLFLFCPFANLALSLLLVLFSILCFYFSVSLFYCLHPNRFSSFLQTQTPSCRPVFNQSLYQVSFGQTSVPVTNIVRPRLVFPGQRAHHLWQIAELQQHVEASADGIQKEEAHLGESFSSVSSSFGILTALICFLNICQMKVAS